MVQLSPRARAHPRCEVRWLPNRLASSLRLWPRLQRSSPAAQNMRTASDDRTLRKCGNEAILSTLRVGPLGTTILASFPGLPTVQFLHTASDQKLDSGKAWERG